jgi:hypothetical protein
MLADRESDHDGIIEGAGLMGGTHTGPRAWESPSYSRWTHPALASRRSEASELRTGRNGKNLGWRLHRTSCCLA